MAPAPPLKSSPEDSDSEDGMGISKLSATARQVSQASTALSLEELSSPAFFSRQCTEIDSLVEESNINQAMMSAAVSDRNFCVTVANPRHNDIPLIAVSEKFEAMTGYRRAEMLGKGCRTLSNDYPNDMMILAGLRGACRTGTSWTGVLINRRKSGELFMNLVDVRGLTVARNRRTGEPLWFLIGIHSDVTEEAEANGGELRPDRAEQIHEVASSIRSRLAEDFSRMAVSGALQVSAATPGTLAVDHPGSAEEWVLLPSPMWIGEDPGSDLDGQQSPEHLAPPTKAPKRPTRAA